MVTKNKTLEYDEDQGTLKIGPLRYVLMRPDTLSEIQKGVEDRLGRKSSEFLYAAGAYWAVGSFRRLSEVLDHDPEELMGALCMHATSLGWGLFKPELFEPTQQRIAIRVLSSPFATAYGQSDEPVCHLICGVVGGWTEAFFNMPASCIEQACLAQGNPDCLFVATGHDVAGKEAWDW